jgi:hypothetical protein
VNKIKISKKKIGLRTLILLGLFFCRTLSFSQSIKDKKVSDLDLYDDLTVLESMGLNRVDVEFMKYITANENKNFTVANYQRNIKKYRQMPDYKLIKNMWLDHSPKSVESPFPDSFSVQYKYEDGLKISAHKNKDVLIIFAAHGSVNSHHLQNAIFHNAFNNVHKKYIIIWLYVDTPQSDEANKNFDIEMSIYKSNVQPYSVLLKNGKITNTYEGFSTLDLNRYRIFLKI